MIPRRSTSTVTITQPRSLAIPPGTPSPAAFGLPEKFDSWRPGQYQAVEQIIDSPQRFVVLCCPTGSGKSAIAVAAAVMSDKRTCYLTATKGLQDQLSNDFGGGVHDIRGMANYKCPIALSLGLSEHTTVTEAPCQCGYGCMLRITGECEYFGRYRCAQSAPLVLSNFQCWMYDSLKGPDGIHIERYLYDLNKELDDDKDPRVPIDVLVCDEASECVEEISRFVGVQISRRECLQLHIEWPDQLHELDQWRDWAQRHNAGVTDRLEQWKLKLRAGSNGAGRGWSREVKLLRDMQRKLARLTTIKAEDDWIVDEQQDRDTGDQYAVKFAPLNPARYAEQALWRGVQKIVLMSATIRPKTAELLGIDPSEMVFTEYPSGFDKRRRPIMVVPSVMLNYNAEKSDQLMTKWLHRIDAVIANRLDRKGIIHAVSYSRARFIKDNSEFGKYMMIHDASTRAATVEEFKQAAAPAILVSPSVDTGYDFAGDLARWIIIAKIPFASIADKLVKARQARDPEYSTFITAQTIVQASGRAMRSSSDFAETLILDDAFGNWFFYKAKKFLPHWWIEAIVWATGVPAPMQDPDGVEV